MRNTGSTPRDENALILQRARIDAGSITGKNFNGYAPIPSMIRGYSRSKDREDRICQTSVWICKEQAFWLVTGVVLLYTLMEEKRFGSI